MIIPPPKYDAEEPPVRDETREERIREYIAIEPWKCSVCGTVMFGHMTYCAYCKLRSGIITEKPR